ncbi:VanZ family protein [Candidatus Latescibacterota bacterium]
MFTDLEKKSPFVVYKAPALVYAGLIFVMSSISGYELPELPFYSFDKIVHSLEFGLFGMLLYRAFRYPRPFSRPYLFTLGTGIPWAAMDEIHQLYVPGRNCDPVDFIMDVLGLVVFAGISVKLNSEKRNRNFY